MRRIIKRLTDRVKIILRVVVYTAFVKGVEMMTSTAEIMDLGMNCLLEKLGTVETEHFISVILREKSDYTKWRQKYFDNVSSDDFQAAAVDYARNNPL